MKKRKRESWLRGACNAPKALVLSFRYKSPVTGIRKVEDGPLVPKLKARIQVLPLRSSGAREQRHFSLNYKESAPKRPWNSPRPLGSACVHRHRLFV
jgi:hypothetical protein